MALTSNPIMSGDGSVVFSDGTVSPITITIPFEHGNFSFGELSHLQKEVVEMYARDRWYAAREGRDITPEFTFSADLPGLTDATTKSIWDAVRRTGTFASAVSTLPAAAGGMNSGGTKGVYTLQGAWTFERSDLGGTADTVLTLKYCRLSVTIEEGGSNQPAKITVKGKAFPYSTDWITVAG